MSTPENEYPRWIDDPNGGIERKYVGGEVKKRILVNDAKHEAEVTGKKAGWDKLIKKEEIKKD